MRTKRKASEESLQVAISTYLRLQYPNVLFTAESSGIRLTMGQAVKAKKQRSDRALPDLWIMEPKGRYHGLIIELKKNGESPWKKDGHLKKKTMKNSDGTKYDHIQEQSDILRRFLDKGYAATFSVGFDQTKKIIDDYMRMN